MTVVMENARRKRTMEVRPKFRVAGSACVPCPECGARMSSVLDCRASGNAVRRRRECECGRRFTTYECLAPGQVADYQI